VKAAAQDLPVLKGERRVPKPMGGRIHLYSDVLSTRTRMKRANARAEIALQRQAEPWAALAWVLGREYPGTQLDTAWKLLLRGHAHDSIAGTGVDDIEQDMLHRLRQVTNISRGLTRRSLEHLQLQVDNSDAAPEDVLLTVFNPSPYPRSEVITAAVDLPEGSGYEHVSLRAPGRPEPVPIQIVSRKPHHSVVNHAGNATAMMTCDRAVVHFEAAEVPGFGYATYHLDREPYAARGGLVCGPNAMENEDLRVDINGDGTLRVLHRGTDTVFDGLHYFEDGGEAGNAWMHVEPALDSVITSRGGAARIGLEEDGPLLARYRIEVTMDVPAGLEENGGDPWQRLDGGENASSRTDETRKLAITSWVTLRKGAGAVDLVTRFDNPCKNHRLRALFPTRLNAATCHVESAFDVVEREIEHGPDSPWAEAVKPTFPMQRFVDVSHGDVGLAVINDGLREYEVTADADRSIAMTLLRAFEVSLTTVSYRWEAHPEMLGSQCLGAHEFRYAVYPHAWNWDEAEVYREAERLMLPMEPAQAGPHGGSLPKRHGFLSLEPANLILSAVKRAEDGEGLVVRLFNPTGAHICGRLTLDRSVASAAALTLEETQPEPLATDGKSVTVEAAPKQIATVSVCFA